MSALGESYGNHGAKHEFKLRDTAGELIKVYTLLLVDDDVKGQLEKKIFERARDVLYGLRSGMTENMYERRLEKLADDYMEGFFSPFTSEEGQKFLKSTQGALELMGLIFQCPVAEAASLGSNSVNQLEIKSLMRIVLQESFRGIDMKKVEQKAEEEEKAQQEKDKNKKESEGNAPLARKPAGLRV